jgi:hypothetical protein
MAEKKIKGQTFKVEPMLATEAVRLQARLLKVLGGGIDRLPEILSGAGSKATPEQKEKSNAAAVAAFTDIFVNGDPNDMADLVKDVVEVAMVKRPSGVYEQVDMDGDFTGNLGAMMQVAVFVLREVFGDFFSDILASGSLEKLTKG